MKSKFVNINRKFELEKSAYQDIGIASALDFVYSGIASQMSMLETSYLINEIQKNKTISTHHIRIQNLNKKLIEICEKMVNDNCESNVIFIPGYLKSEFQSQQDNKIIEKDLRIGTRLLTTVNSNQLKDGEIIIANKNCFKTTYKKQQGNRLKVTIDENPQKKINALIDVSMEIKNEIINPDCISRIIVSNLKKSRYYLEMVKRRKIRKPKKMIEKQE